MIVDTSALLAILLGEPDARRYAEALAAARASWMSAATYVEAGVVTDANGDPVLSRRLDELMAEANISVVPFTPEHAVTARAAYRDFGKGSGHPARLNLGDCFSYALARARHQPLLFNGDDFVHTDVAPALA